MKKVLAIALALAAGNALAAAGSTTFQVTAKVNPTCDIVVPTLDLGTYDAVAGGTQDAYVDMTLHCTKFAMPKVSLDAGKNSGGSFSPRLMKGLASGNNDTLQYNIYSDSGYSVVWTDVANNGSVSPATASAGKGTAISLRMYGRILANNNDVQADTYADTVTATVTF